MFWKPQPLQLVKKVLQYTSNLYGSTPPICIAVLSWLLSFEERETLQYASHFVLQYASHLYGSTPLICTAALLEKYWGVGSPERFWYFKHVNAVGLRNQDWAGAASAFHSTQPRAWRIMWKPWRQNSWACTKLPACFRLKPPFSSACTCLLMEQESSHSDSLPWWFWH